MKYAHRPSNLRTNVFSITCSFFVKFCKNRMSAGADPGFPIGGGANPRGEGHQHTNLPDFPKNYMKLRKFWSVGGRTPGAPPSWIHRWSAPLWMVGALPSTESQICPLNIFFILDSDLISLADPRGAARDARPLGSKFFHFHAVFGKKFEK